MDVDPVIAEASLQLGADQAVAKALPALARGRPLVIDYHLTRMHGVAVGDLRVFFPDWPLPPRYVRLAPVGGVEVLVDKSLLRIVEGASLRVAGLPLMRHLDLTLRSPERWLELIDTLPIRHS